MELTKKEIRSKILFRLQSQKEEDRDRKSKTIKEKLFRTKVFKKAKNIMFYIAFGGEVKTEEMIKEAQKLGKLVAVPICRHDRITIRPCALREGARLKTGLYGICEPAKRKFIRSQELSLVVVPGLAFDKSGNRLGRGKGCYDRFLKKLSNSIPTIGLAFDFQILTSLSAKAHDIKVKKVLFA
ncbi:MAG: 5-formyltetrahydrofolate cyclo-ligase [Candidatus Omnitrophota bacterium]